MAADYLTTASSVGAPTCAPVIRWKTCPRSTPGARRRNCRKGEHIVLPQAGHATGKLLVDSDAVMGIPLEQFSHSTGTLNEIQI